MLRMLLSLQGYSKCSRMNACMEECITIVCLARGYCYHFFLQGEVYRVLYIGVCMAFHTQPQDILIISGDIGW